MYSITVRAAHSSAVAVKRHELRHFAKAHSIRLSLGEVKQSLVEVDDVRVVPASKSVGQRN
jgi:hypothetical protein